MRRTPEQRKIVDEIKKINRESKAIFPLFFWVNCYVCKHDFKWEYGFAVIYEQIMDMEGGTHNKYKYICTHCADTNKEAYDIVNEMKNLEKL